MKFRVKVGSHIHNKREYPAGSIIESQQDLCAIFANKFERVDGNQYTENTAPVRSIPISEPTMPDVFREDPALAVADRTGVFREDSEPNPVTSGKPAGKDVTKGFPVAVEQDYKVYRDGELFFVYDADDLSKPVNTEGVPRAGVAKVIAKALE